MVAVELSIIYIYIYIYYWHNVNKRMGNKKRFWVVRSVGQQTLTYYINLKHGFYGHIWDFTLKYESERRLNEKPS